MSHMLKGIRIHGHPSYKRGSLIDRVKGALRYIWNCMCYAEGINGWLDITNSGGITPQEYCAIEKRLRQKYIEREE